MPLKLSHSDEAPALNLTSMIDVVFTLLAFFIITVRVFGAERDAVVGPAGAAGKAGLEPGDLPQQIVIVLQPAPTSSESSAASSMRILIGGHVYTQPAAITQQLREINLPDVQVVFASSPQLAVEQVASAVDAALVSPMKRVTLRQATSDDWTGATPP